MTEAVKSETAAQVLNWLKDAERYERDGKLIFTGPCPIDATGRAGADQLWGCPWVISHPEARDKLWRMTQFGAFGFNRKAGDPISITVVEWPAAAQGVTP